MKVNQTITVSVPPARAFEAFTRDLNDWWPRSHHIGEGEDYVTKFEPEVEGRWIETHASGEECQLGRILVWEPPHRIVFTWEIGVDWKIDPSTANEIEVTFSAVGDSGTRVDLEHRKIEKFGERAEAIASAVAGENGWPLILAHYRDSLIS